MRRQTLATLLGLCVVTLMLALVAGCSTTNTSGTGQGSGGRMMGGSGSNTGSSGGMMGGSGTGSYSSVGERIFLTGVGSDGQAIGRTAPAVSQGSLMMGGNGCGSCHSANGRGGKISMMSGVAIDAPDITYDALIKVGFTDATIGRAIREGVDESGEPLKDAMPRWQMSDADVAATIAYLKQLNTQ